MSTMVDLTADRATDPDAQAVVTDFLDYTEYLPSDILRSLTLVRGLDETYHRHAHALHDLSKLYGTIPSLEPSMRPDIEGLRLDITSNLDRALIARESAYVEACRLFDVADRHQNRLKSIVAKLRAIPKPPSRDPTPQPPTSAQKRSRAGRELKHGMSTARLTLHPPRGNAVASSILSRPRGRRITVPGEVMPPYDPDEAIASTEVSDWESPPPSPPRPVLKLKQPKPPKEKPEPAEKPPRAPREHATYRKPTPPPEDVPLGSKYAPWTHLTEYEMYRLRKKMKKNHNWEPSPVMIRRELESRGRGWDNYYKARAEAQVNGTPFMDIEDRSQETEDKPDKAEKLALPEKVSKTERSEKQERTERTEPSATPVAVATPDPRPKAAKRSEAKKDKKADVARSQAALAARDAELAARRLGDIGSAFKNLFSPITSALASLNRSASTPSANTPTTGKKQPEKTAKKRKRDEAVSASPSLEAETQKKRQKIVPSKLSPLPPSEPAQTSAGTIKIPLKLNVASQISPASESTTPAAGTRAASAARSSVAPKTEELTPPPASRPVSRASRRSTAPSAGEAEPFLQVTEPTPVATRAASRKATPAATAHQTPIADTSPKAMATAASRRSKREVPGTVMHSSQDGGAAVSVSKRKIKPGKQTKAQKAGVNPASPEVRVDKDGNTEIIDPAEERYCICGDISWGEMICCELDDKCEFGQWFHMECVELASHPARTTKWYCPGDRKKYHRGEDTNGLVGRGVKV